MKGIAQYILILLVTAFTVIFSFYLLSQLLSKEEEVSTISRIFASLINKVEYSRSYFIRMMENEYSILRNNYKKEEIVAKLPKEYEVKMESMVSKFKVYKVETRDDGIKMEILQESTYSDSLFKLEANGSFVLYLK